MVDREDPVGFVSSLMRTRLVSQGGLKAIQGDPICALKGLVNISTTGVLPVDKASLIIQCFDGLMTIPPLI